MTAMTEKEFLRDCALRWAGLAADKQFAGRKGHGGNPDLAERHLTRQQLIVLFAAAFEAGAELGGPSLKLANHAELLERALRQFIVAFDNNGETTSLKEWNERMKVAKGDALEALAGRLSYAEPKAEAA